VSNSVYLFELIGVAIIS